MRLGSVAAVLLVAFVLPGCLKGNGGIFGGDDPPGPRDYVSSSQYTKWVIEIDTIQGQAPPASALNLLKSRLESVADKPGGIELRNDDSLPARGGKWTLDDIQKYSSQHLDAKTSGDTAVIHLLFLDGQFENDRALAVTVSSYRGDTVVSSGPVAVFSDHIRDSCSILSTSPCTDPTPIWGPVLVHEFGHAMGLVNVGAPMKTPHEDPNSPGHSNNDRSVMAATVETSGVVALLTTGGIPDDYDSNDRADLCGIGGKC